MSKVQPGYTPPVGSTVRRYLNLQYSVEKTKLLADLEAEDAVSMTCDFWTSSAKHSYISATGHYIDINWILKHPVLATRRVIGQHTGEVINSVLNDIRREFNIHSKVAGLTTDNASNMKKAASLQEYITCSDASISCMAHTLQLAVEDGLKLDEIKAAAANARGCVGYFNRSTVASDALEQYQIRQNPDIKPLVLIQDVITRWNSMYFMFDRLVKLRAPIYAILYDRKYTKSQECRSNEISDKSWFVIENLLPVLKPLAEATDALSSETYPSISCILPMINGLSKNELAPNDGDAEIIKTFKEKVVNGLKRFKMPESEMFAQSAMAVATLLDPRHKSLSIIADQNIKLALKNFVLSLLEAQSNTGNNIKQEQPSPAKKQKSVFSYLDGDFSDDDENESSLESELDSYLVERVTKRGQKNPLQWWKINEEKFPNVAKLARKFLCIMGTSVPSERVFSIAGLTVTDKRSQLDPEAVDQIIFMNKVLHKRLTEEKAMADQTVKQEAFSISIKQETQEESATADLPLPTLY